MDYTEYTGVKNAFLGRPNLCDLFKLLSIETWKRIEYAYLKPGIKVFETTLTQNLLFSINAYNDQYHLNIDIFEAKDEATNGNDFELIIRFPKEGIEYYAPVQAKKLYRNGKYNSMEHGDQIESLIRYARSRNAKPLFLLYNFTELPIRTGVVLSTPEELFGCSIVSAEHLFDNYYNKRYKRGGRPKWLIPKFYDLNPTPAFPWHHLVCSNGSVELFGLLQKRGLIEPNLTLDSVINTANELNQGFYPINTFTPDDKWINTNQLTLQSEPTDRYYTVDTIKESGKVSKSRNSDLSEIERVYPVFAPKSRIVLTK